MGDTITLKCDSCRDATQERDEAELADGGNVHHLRCDNCEDVTPHTPNTVLD